MSKTRARKTLILIRHAHRDTTDRSADNGLSAKGRKQAARLAELKGLAAPGEYLTSPKKRCRETLAPLAERAGAGTGAVVEKLLDEQGLNESEAGLRSRVRRFARWWAEKGGPLTYACSHGDWLPLAIEELTGESRDLDKGAYARLVLEADGDGARLEELVQEP